MFRINSVSESNAIALSDMPRKPAFSNLFNHLKEVGQVALSPLSFQELPITSQPVSLPHAEMEYVPINDAQAEETGLDAKKDNAFCLGFFTDNTVCNIPNTISYLWGFAKKECVNQLERNVTQAINKLSDEIMNEASGLVDQIMSLLVADEETTKKYVSAAIEKARLEQIVELLMSEVGEREKILERNRELYEDNGREVLKNQMDEDNKVLDILNVRLDCFKSQLDESNNVLEILRGETSLLNNFDAYKVIKSFLLNLVKFKSTVALGYISYGQEYDAFSPAYSRVTGQVRLVISPEDVMGMIARHEHPQKISPDIYLNTEVGVRTSFPVLEKLANINEKSVSLNLGSGVMMRDRLGVGCVLQYNPEKKSYEIGHWKDWTFVHEQLTRARVNVSLLGSEFRVGVQGSNYASSSVNKAIYSFGKEKIKIISNIGITAASAASTGMLAYMFLPPDIARTFGAGVAGQMIGGYLAGKLPKVAPSKQSTQSIEINNAGIALGVPVQTGLGGGLVFRGSGKIPIVSRDPDAAIIPPALQAAQFRRRDRATLNNE
ncbi:hypothetical protein [Rouxiella sp. WC2420]|uniref:Uncharacterized protein n=1 Tax=Rouxiella sp. WC2420 TaxID=3234145 RepID=A0AB39VNG8_9GAMM